MGKNEQTGRWNEKWTADEYWCTDLWDIAPRSLALAYHDLHDYVCEGNIGCTLFLIRDVYELMLRIPITVLFHGIYAVRDQVREDEFDSILKSDSNLCMLYQKSLRLLCEGDWNSCTTWAARLQEDLFRENLENAGEAAVYQTTIEYLRTLEDRINRTFLCGDRKERGMVAWRNDTLGHGCLAQHPGEYYTEIPDILEILRDIAAVSLDYYRNISFADADGNLLCGYETEVQNPDSEIQIRSLCGGAADPIFIRMNHPFFNCKDENMACYDGLKNRKAAFLLNYTTGRKFENKTLSEYLAPIASRQRIDLADRGIYSDTLETADIEALEKKLTGQDKIIGIDFLYEWLMESVNGAEKGLLLLQAEHGRGKSTFCRSINPFTEENQGRVNWKYVTGLNTDLRERWKKFEDQTAIRVYHFRSDHSSRPDFFLSELKKSLLALKYNHENDLGDVGEFRDTWNELEHCKKEERPQRIAKVLNTVLKNHRNSTVPKERLLLVLDGLDEVSDWKAISSYLPDAGSLEKNIFILCTCRVEAELEDKAELTTFLKGTSFMSQRIFGRDDTSAFVETYTIEILRDLNRLPKKIADRISAAKALAEQFEYRFSALAAYRKLCRMNPEFYPPQEKNLFHQFMTEIERRSPRAYINGIRNLLAALAWADSPLTIREWAYLSGEECVTFQMLGMIDDLQVFVMASRSDRGNVYAFRHVQWAEAVRQEFPEAEWEFICRCGELVERVEQQFSYENISEIFSDATFEGEYWVLLHTLSVYSAGQAALEEHPESLRMESLEKLLLRFVMRAETIRFPKPELKLHIRSIEKDYDKITDQFALCKDRLLSAKLSCFEEVWNMRRLNDLYAES